MEVIRATGKRKRATAQVVLKEGKGERQINGRGLKEYFGREDLLRYIESPFKVMKEDVQFDITAIIKGGGVSSQAGALALGISRALLKIDPEVRKALKSQDLLRRDPREKERRKCGKKKARKSFQWTKR